MKAKRRRRVAQPCRHHTLKEALRDFLTPAVWKQAQQQRRRTARKTSSRWTTQPLVLMLLFMTWCNGDSQAERFETAKAYCQVCLHKRRRPGKTVQGYQRALARLPVCVLRTLAAAVRKVLAERLRCCWQVGDFVPIGCDGSRLECPRTAELEARLGQAGKDGAAPTLWVTALVHLRWGVPWAWRLGKGTASERAHLEQLLGLLPRLALLVADAGYFGYGLTRRLVENKVAFLLRMSSNVTLYTKARVPLEGFREGIVYYWPSARAEKDGALPLRLRLLRIRSRGHKHAVWLLTNVEDRRRLSRALAGQMYRWRWLNEGCFRTYKHTLRKVKLVSRTVRLVHREAEGSWLALQLLLAQGALAQCARPSTQTPNPQPACSARQILLAIRAELQGSKRRGQPHYSERLRRAQLARRPRTSAKDKRAWPRRKAHEPPKPPQLLTLTDDRSALVARLESEAA